MKENDDATCLVDVVTTTSKFGETCAICNERVDKLYDSRRYFNCPICKELIPLMHVECALFVNLRHRGDAMACSYTKDCKGRLELVGDTSTIKNILQFKPPETVHKGISSEINPVVEAVNMAMGEVVRCGSERRKFERNPVENATLSVALLNAALFSITMAILLIFAMIETEHVEIIPFMALDLFGSFILVITAVITIVEHASLPSRPGIVASWICAFFIALMFSLFASWTFIFCTETLYLACCTCAIVTSARRLYAEISYRRQNRTELILRSEICAAMASSWVELLKTRTEKDDTNLVSAIEYEQAECKAFNSIASYKADRWSYSFLKQKKWRGWYEPRHTGLTPDEKFAAFVVAASMFVGL